MKKTLLTLSISLFVCVVLFSQTPLKLTHVGNAYHAGDSLYKYQVEYKSPGSMGKELEWDFTKLDILDDNYLIKYFHPDTIDTARICGMEHRTRYYYRQECDSLWATGFENYTTLMDYTTPELKMKFPFSYGDTLYSEFTGEGMYSNMLQLGVKGFTRVKADAEGSLKLPNLQGRTLRTHTRRHYTQVKTRNDPNPFREADTIPRNNNDTLQMTLDTYSWYMKDIRYPVFESIKSTLHLSGKAKMDTTVFYTSFYYTPEELPPYVEEPDIPEIEKVFTEASFAPNPVENDLNISYKLTREALVQFSLHSSVGQPLRQTSPQTQNEGYHFIQIPMGTLPKGAYTLYIHVDDMVISKVVVKK